MNDTKNAALSVECSPEQASYAKMMRIGSNIGIVLLLIFFTIYLTGLLKPFIPMNELPLLWGQSVEEFHAQSNMPHGWQWIKMLKYGDVLNLLGIAFLAGLSIFAYMAIIPKLIRAKDYIMGIIAIAEVFILVLAASGLLSAGH